jgi:predicted RNase H-like nuclease (RuvC/YqgF family)
VGNTFVKSIGGQVGWSTFSDGRYKKNIKEDVKGLSFINKLRPITYTVDINGLNEYYNKGRKHDGTYEKMKATIQPSTDEAAKIVYNGFIAQEVETAAKNLNYDFSGVDKPKINDGLYGLRYADFVVPLVKAVQELSGQNEKLKNQNEDLEQRVAKLEAMMNVQSSTTNNKQQTINVSSASLEQNIPNPFSDYTIINYTLSESFSSAQIIVTDKSGKVINKFRFQPQAKALCELMLPLCLQELTNIHYWLMEN